MSATTQVEYATCNRCNCRTSKLAPGGLCFRCSPRVVKAAWRGGALVRVTPECARAIAAAVEFNYMPAFTDVLSDLLDEFNKARAHAPEESVWAK